MFKQVLPFRHECEPTESGMTAIAGLASCLEVVAVGEKDWHPLEREIEGRKLATGQEWAEVCFVPTWAARSKKGPSHRFLAIRELLGQKEFPGMEAQLPFPP